MKTGKEGITGSSLVLDQHEERRAQIPSLAPKGFITIKSAVETCAKTMEIDAASAWRTLRDLLVSGSVVSVAVNSHGFSTSPTTTWAHPRNDDADGTGKFKHSSTVEGISITELDAFVSQEGLLEHLKANAASISYDMKEARKGGRPPLHVIEFLFELAIAVHENGLPDKREPFIKAIQDLYVKTGRSHPPSETWMRPWVDEFMKRCRRE